MRVPGLKAQWLAASALAPLFAVAAGGALWTQARAHAELEAAFQRQLGALAQLPRLREDVRRLEAATARYLDTGDARHLAARRRVLDDARRLTAAAARVAEGDEEAALADRLGRELAAAVSEQESWIARRTQGRLGPAARLPSREAAVAELVEVLAGLKDANRGRLEERRRAVEAGARRALGLLIGGGLGAGALLSWGLARLLVAPLSRLQAYAAGWRLGEAWDPPPDAAVAEVAALRERLGEAAERLRGQFDKEVELGRLKTQLVAMVSHEFNNSLSVLGGIAKLLKDGEPAPASPKRAGYYTVIEAQVRLLSVSSRTLLELGRLEAGRLKVHPAPMDLSALARRAAAALEVLWTRKRQSLSAPPEAEACWVRGDADALTLVVTNLVANAVKYTPEGGRIELAVARAGDGAVLSVRDTGIGVSPEDQRRIMAGYFRTEEGKKAAKGFGVGLALVQAVLSAHGAELSVESSPGAGAVFSFRLPACPAPPPPA